MVSNRVRLPSSSRTDGSEPDFPDPTPQSESVHVRSYAHERAHDLAIEVAAPDGEVVFRKRYHLPPGRIESEVGAIPEGEYEIRAVLDDERCVSRRCRIDDSPDGTAVVEIGNGVLSLTEGLVLP
jgi:hypothetical protein